MERLERIERTVRKEYNIERNERWNNMYTRGEYRDSKNTYQVILDYKKKEVEVVLVQGGTVCSAYKQANGEEYSFLSNKAKEFWKVMQNGLKSCTSKNGVAVPFVYGTSLRHEFTKTKIDYCIETYNGEICLSEVKGDEVYILLQHHDGQSLIPPNIPYIKLTKATIEFEANGDEDVNIPIRTVQEIALEKEDITWLRGKKYHIVNDDETAEKLFNFFDSYNGVISYDTETTGLRINCFGKINSEYARELAKWNSEHPDDQIRADKLVGIIFCIEKDVSYYFPVANRKYKNLYEDKNSEVRKKTIQNIKARYTVGDLRDREGDMKDYVLKTPEEEFSCDVILMERVRNILETKHIVAHNGAFEWKVDWLYEIDTNLKDDTMILHQIMYKFRSTTSNRGESSSLKYLAKRELGIEQWELTDFFPTMKEDNKGEVRSKGKKKKENRIIDFSYMDYEGTRIYAPADGDITYQLFMKYKRDLIENHKEQEYLYNVEVLVACAVGYMEFYGHRLDEDKITEVRDKTKAEVALVESEIRQLIGYSTGSEIQEYHNLKALVEKNDNSLLADIVEGTAKLKSAIDSNVDNVINLASPAQVCKLFYEDLQIPFSGDKPSVAKKVVKSLLKAKDDEGNPKYPIVHLYSKYKNFDTLLTKFFDNLPYYMYPGGYIFSHFGQISTATGRMSANGPNCQQYPKSVTNIVSPRENYIMMDADYSQIEYRVLVALSGEEKLAEMFADPDSDYHTLMASLMYGVPYASVTPKMRGDAKSFNFGIPYGMGFKSLAILLTGMSGPIQVEEAKEKYELYFKDQPKTRKFFNQVKEMASVNKYTKTFWNRYRYYSFEDKDGNTSEFKKAAALRQAGNAIIQGCLDGDTRIQTKEFGIVKIKDVVDNRLKVWDGDKWSNGDILYSGKKRKCTVRFSNGQSIVCSPIHKFLVVSHRGKKRFVECKDLLSKEKSKSPHRVVINQKYEKSDYKYSSEWAHKYKGQAHNSNNVFLDNIESSFDIGVTLGRLASDGSVLPRDVGASSIVQFVAEHEYDVAEELNRCMSKLNVSKKTDLIRKDRTEEMTKLTVYSKSLVSEISDLDIKNKIHDNIFMDTEVLRGFLRGYFDGDGGVSGKVIQVVFGKQRNFEKMCKDMQKALLFFGIRSRYYEYPDRYTIRIKTNDNAKFMSMIGFINKDKTEKANDLECFIDEHIFGPCLVVESVEITDEYIDMYDVCNTDDGYYVADGIITHNTAADIFKISVARNFMYIRKNKLLGLFLIINMIHDEQLFEINYKKLNVQRVLRDVGVNMQFKVNGFPPLYIGAGIGPTWSKAKGKMTEIHPNLLDELSHEADNMPIFKTEETNETDKDILKYFADRVYDFRLRKVRDYLLDVNNHGKDIHPAIGNLLNLQFSYGHDKDAEGLSDDEFTTLCLTSFIKENNLDLDPSLFKAQVIVEEEEEEDEYTDGEEDEHDLIEDDYTENSFAIIEETDTVYGASVQDLIKLFGTVVSKAKRLCGIDITRLNYKQRDKLIGVLEQHVCDESDLGSMEVVFLKDAGILNRTGIWVKGIDGSALETRLKIMDAEDKFGGTVNERLAD